MMIGDHQEPISDPLLASAVASLREDDLRQVDWARLRDSINRGAEAPLARRRRGSIGIFRPLVTLAAAAGLAYLLWAGPGMFSDFATPEASEVTTAQSHSDERLKEVLGRDLTEREFRLLVTGKANPERLLAFAIGRR